MDMSLPKPVRIAMWSGPRNISTAMMRSWGNRTDTVVCDEPLYAYYLLTTGAVHPGRDEVISRHECDWRKVVAELCGPIPDARSIFYQKHMAHHLLPEIDRAWLSGLTHAFLIRNPREMLTSLVKNVSNPSIDDTGLPQQLEILRFMRDRSMPAPPIIDSRDVLENPRRLLSLLCERLGVPFSDAMLSWPAGRRETDGVWAPHWYAAVERSTGFERYQPKLEPLPATLEVLERRCRDIYEELHAQRLR